METPVFVSAVVYKGVPLNLYKEVVVIAGVVEDDEVRVCEMGGGDGDRVEVVLIGGGRGGCCDEGTELPQAADVDWKG